MKLKIKFGKEIRFTMPIQAQNHSPMGWVTRPRHLFRALALAEQPKPCKRHVD